MAILIRHYKDTDLSAVMSAWESANALAHPFLEKGFVDKLRHDIPNIYLPNADVWVSEYNGKVVGFIALIENEVGAIFVDTQFHKLGIGKTLMDKAVSLHPKLEVDVFTDNAMGRRFYSSYGFTQMLEKTHEETKMQVLRLMSST
ncbi:MAG: GNAT family N-acetyltransferase [Alphaproteobacteria bacterium]